MNSSGTLIIAVTGSGKGKLAFELARTLDGEIISVDSMKVYRRMDIGTAKPPLQARNQIKYHLIDVVEPSESFSAGRFLELENEAIEQIKARGKPVVAAGGTALYIKALLYGLFEGPDADEKIRARLKETAKSKGLEMLHSQLARIDPQAAQRIHPNDKRRIIRAMEVYELTGRPISQFQQQFEAEGALDNWTIIGLRRDKQTESQRINARVKKMVEAGLVDEVKSLLKEEKPLSKQARSAIGYAEIIEYLDGKTSLPDAVEKIKKNSRQLAKHQRTWFKTFKNVRWIDIEKGQTGDEILSQVKKLLG